MPVSNTTIFGNLDIINKNLNNLYNKYGYNGFKLGYWNFLSVSDIRQYENMYLYKMIDIATKYIGMGHYAVLSYIPETKNYCVRNDGGSNDYERQDNYEKYENNNYQPADFEIYTKTCTLRLLSYFCININNDVFEENKQYDFNSMLILLEKFY
uniref:Uncharacterized protein n=1 Tax=viral metagenome TaxID=1070528 RepID=A0A6C0E3K8_9ZZZZ